MIDAQMSNDDLTQDWCGERCVVERAAEGRPN